jgi:hypothetical protein
MVNEDHVDVAAPARARRRGRAAARRVRVRERPPRVCRCAAPGPADCDAAIDVAFDGDLEPVVVDRLLAPGPPPTVDKPD